jgi:Tfp pilus assembly protein PilN
MAAREKESQINLLPQKEFAASTLGRILTWILSTFRIIVIVTEIIVMIAFLSRFWLDAKNTDLNEEIKRKQAAIAASLPFENDFKDIQARLDIYAGLAREEGVMSNTVSMLASYLPPDVVLTSLTFGKSGVEIGGMSPSETSVARLIANLQGEDSFQNVRVTEIRSGEKDISILSFKIALEFKKEEQKI